jgi:hypothetical protein
MRRPRVSRRFAAGAFAALTMVVAPAAHAQQVYKHVDDKGNVVYSQTPPAGKEADKVKVAPAYRSSAPPVRDYDTEVIRRQQAEDRRRENERLREEQRQQQEEARRKRDAALEAECVRNRGTDCSNPETWRRMEADQRPGSGPPRNRR